jgi:hypothetical protein
MATGIVFYVADIPLESRRVSWAMTALRQKRTLGRATAGSALPPPRHRPRLFVEAKIDLVPIWIGNPDVPRFAEAKPAYQLMLAAAWAGLPSGATAQKSPGQCRGF